MTSDLTHLSLAVSSHDSIVCASRKVRQPWAPAAPHYGRCPRDPLLPRGSRRDARATGAPQSRGSSAGATAAAATKINRHRDNPTRTGAQWSTGVLRDIAQPYCTGCSMMRLAKVLRDGQGWIRNEGCDFSEGSHTVDSSAPPPQPLRNQDRKTQ